MKPTYFLGILMLISLYWMQVLYHPFLLNIAIAILLVLATSHIYNFFFKHLKGPFAASLLSTLVVALLFFAPIVYFITTIAIQIVNIDLNILTHMLEQFKAWVNEDLPQSLQFLKPHILEFIDSGNIATLATEALNIIAKVGAKSAGFITDVGFIIVFYFFVVYYGKAMAGFFLEITPLEREHTLRLFNGTTNVMSVVFYSILVTAIFEGALFAIVAYIFDYDALLFGILYGFASLIPIVGAALMWVPISLYELSQGNVASAIFIALYTIIIISIVADTFVKPIIIKYINLALLKSKVVVNELIVFFAILAGLSTFGFWGMIIGPAITTFFISLLRLYRDMRVPSNKENPIALS